MVEMCQCSNNYTAYIIISSIGLLKTDLRFFSIDSNFLVDYGHLMSRLICKIVSETQSFIDYKKYTIAKSF